MGNNEAVGAKDPSCKEYLISVFKPERIETNGGDDLGMFFPGSGGSFRDPSFVMIQEAISIYRTISLLFDNMVIVSLSNNLTMRLLHELISDKQVDVPVLRHQED